MLLTTLLYLLTSAWAWFNYDFSIPQSSRQTEDSSTLRLELRHVHAVSSEARVVWANVSQTESFTSNLHGPPYYAQTRRMKSSRPTSHEAFIRARSLSRIHRQSAILDWDEGEVVGPDVESRGTLLELAKMTNNAYLQPNETGWYDLGSEWNVVSLRHALIAFDLFDGGDLVIVLRANHCVPYSSRTPLAGSLMQTASGDMYSRHQTTPL